MSTSVLSAAISAADWRHEKTTSRPLKTVMAKRSLGLSATQTPSVLRMFHILLAMRKAAEVRIS